MEIKQIFIPRMANFAYLIGDPDTGTCAVIDPAFDPQKILDAAQAGGYTVKYVINTHAHSDHTSGNAEILGASGARLCIHKADAQQLAGLLSRAVSRVMGGKGSPRADCLLADHDVIQMGQIELQVIHTPGHTPGSICIYTPGHVFTGDTLFVEAVGRTDLPGGSFQQILASVHERLYTLPADTRVWPGHDYGPSPSSTIGHEKQNNPLS
ncbi:MAG: MBL fold metallo-hydrolase [Desulfobacterales bacterium]